MCYTPEGTQNGSNRATGGISPLSESTRTRKPQNGSTARKLSLPNAVLNKPTRRAAVDIDPYKKLRS